MIEVRLEYMKLKSTRLVAKTQCPDPHFAKTWCSPELHCPVKPRLTYVENVKLVGSDSAFIGSFNDCHHTRFNMINVLPLSEKSETIKRIASWNC